MVEIVLEITVKTAAGSRVGTHQAVQCGRCLSLTANSFPSFQRWLPKLKLQVILPRLSAFPMQGSSGTFHFLS